MDKKFEKKLKKWTDDYEQLKNIPDSILKSTDKQRKFIMERHLYPMPCPLCGEIFGSMDNDENCPFCGIGVKRIVPFIAINPCGWHWSINEKSRKKLLVLWNTSQ